MIRVRKSIEEPQELKQAYNAEGVCRQILEDQNSKCYLCERIVTTNYQVDHLQSQSHHNDLKKSWNNLFISCEYCNARKSDKGDDILHPSAADTEEVIVQQNDFQTKKVLFVPQTSDHAVVQTSALLSHLYNGKSLIRNYKEERFYEEYLRKLNVFQRVVNQYLITHSDDYRKAIIESLHISSELLGFKYHIIKENVELYKEFGSYTIWNRNEQLKN